MASATGFLTSIGTGMGAGESTALYSWTKGRRWRSLQPGDQLESRRLGEADVMRWQRPGDGKVFVICVVLKCPSCLFPIIFRPKAGEEFSIDEDSLLHYRAPVECPATWDQYRDGVPTGRKVACGWKAMIIEGRCHQINGPKDGMGYPTACPCVKPGVDHSPRNCTCGGYPTDDERTKLINDPG